jgi:DNA repair exonuclease SbcCD ATPase subunit
LRNQIKELKSSIDQIRKLQGMSQIMKLGPSDPSQINSNKDDPGYLERELSRLLEQLRTLQIDYKQEFSSLDELKKEVIRIKNTFQNKTKVLGREFNKWYTHQKELLRMAQSHV